MQPQQPDCAGRPPGKEAQEEEEEEIMMSPPVGPLRQLGPPALARRLEFRGELPVMAAGGVPGVFPPCGHALQLRSKEMAVLGMIAASLLVAASLSLFHTCRPSFTSPSAESILCSVPCCMCSLLHVLPVSCL
jgi:hypothetical protein